MNRHVHKGRQQARADEDRGVLTPGCRLARQGELTEIAHGVMERLQPCQEADDARRGLFRPDIAGNKEDRQAVEYETLRQSHFRPEIETRCQGCTENSQFQMFPEFTVILPDIHR